MMDIQKLTIVATLELDAAFYPPDDEQAQTWLVQDILMGEVLILHSNEIGDEVGRVRIESVTESFS
jgi:hypothetical protein